MKQPTQFGVTASRQFLLMCKVMEGIGSIRYRLWRTRANILAKRFETIVNAFCLNARILIASPALLPRFQNLLGQESVFVVLSTQEESKRLDGEWKRLIADMSDALRQCVESPYMIANYEYKLKEFARVNREFREDLVKVSLGIGPVVLMDVGEMIADNHIAIAMQRLSGMLIAIEARAHELLEQHYVPVTGAAYEGPR